MKAADDAVRALRGRGFMVMDGPGDDVVSSTLVFTFAWEAPFMDAVHLRGEYDATAVRARIDNPASMSCLFANDNDNDTWPGEEWWKGEFVGVVSKLLALTPPSKPGRPTTLVMTPSGLWVPSDNRELLLGLR